MKGGSVVGDPGRPHCWERHTRKPECRLCQNTPEQAKILLVECPLDRWDQIWVFWESTSSLCLQKTKWSLHRKEHLPWSQTRGAWNVCMASWNQEITKAFWSAMFNPVRKLCVCRVEGHGSCNRTMTPNTFIKHPGMVQDQTMDCSEVASNDSRCISHWTPVGRCENSSWENATFKSGRTGAVCTIRVGQTTSRKVEEAHSWLQEARDCRYFVQGLCVPPNIKSRVSIVLSIFLFSNLKGDNKFWIKNKGSVILTVK